MCENNIPNNEKDNEVIENELSTEKDNENMQTELDQNASSENEKSDETNGGNLPQDDDKKKKTWIYLLIGIILVGIAIIAFALSRPTHNVENEPIGYLACVEGIKKEMSIEMGTDPKKVNFMSFVKFDKEYIKDVTVDTSKLDLTKEGQYEVIYRIDVKDEEAEDFELKTKVTVVPKEKAEELAEKGEEIVTEQGIQNEKPATPPTKPSNGTSGSTNNSSNSGSSNSGSGSSNTGNSSNQKPTHTHTWVQQYKTVHHEEVGHNEQYLIKEAWTEEFPIYDYEAHSICNGCGLDFTATGADIDKHFKDSYFTGGNCGGYHTEWKTIIIGYDKVEHPAEYETRWVVDQPAWDEQVPDGYKCSCGATK